MAEKRVHLDDTCISGIRLFTKEAPALIEMNIIQSENGYILKTIRFYDNSDNLTDIDKLLKFVKENKGEYSLEILHYDRILNEEVQNEE